MGAGAELSTKKLNTDLTYNYTPEGIETMLMEYHSFIERGHYSWDDTVRDLIVDLEAAFCSSLYTKEERITLALVYFMELSHLEAAKLMKMKVSEVKNNVVDILEKLEAILSGYPQEKLNQSPPPSSTNLHDWMQMVGAGIHPPYIIPDQAITDLLHYLQDPLAQETLIQRSKGIPEELYNEIYGLIPYSEEIWNCYESDHDMRIADKRGKMGYTERMDDYTRGITITGRRTRFVQHNEQNIVTKGKIFK